MSSIAPVVFIGFANDKAAPLPNLKREQEAIERAVAALVDALPQRILLTANDGTSLKAIFETVLRYRERLAVFHYGGHANGTGLDLETPTGNSVAHDRGLAQLLGEAPCLKLVFLNGCATRGQVATLLAAGVRAVIATSVPIQDTMATEFAEQFYDAMGHGNPVQRAFDTARAFVAAKYNAPPPIAQFRDMDWTGKDDAPGDASLTWGLYVRDGGEDALAWTFPVAEALPPVAMNALALDGPINADLQTHLVTALKAIGGPVAAKIAAAEADEDDAERLVVLAIINAFPAPIGEQLRVLFQQDALDLDRLKQLVVTYDVTMQLLAYTMLAQLCAARVARPDLVVADDHRAALNSFLSLDRAALASFDYYSLIVHVLQILHDNQAEWFLIQCDTALAALVDAPSTAAHGFFEQTRRAISGTVSAADLPGLCVAAVGCLCELLGDLAFIVLYKPTTIRSIVVNKYGKADPQFVHTTVALDGVTMPPAQKERSYQAWTDSRSVILQLDRVTGGKYLNLTPLIIDENAFIDARLPKLYFFCYRDQAAGTYVYRLVNNPDDVVAIPDPLRPHLDPVKTMFDEFMAVVFA